MLISTHITVLPDQLADEFWDYNSDEQAAFFSHLGEIASIHDFREQIEQVKREEELTPQGQAIMDLIGGE